MEFSSEYYILLFQVNQGQIVDQWHITVVVSTLRLVSSILRQCPSTLPTFLHIHQVSKKLLFR